MRAGRWIFLAALLGVVGYLARVYMVRRDAVQSEPASPPPKLEHGVGGQQQDWEYTQTDASGSRPRFRVKAKQMRQIESPPSLDLDVVEIQLFHPDGKKFDLVKTDKAQFDEWDPANISPLVAYLSSAKCEFTGETFFVRAGEVTRIKSWERAESVEQNDRWEVAKLTEALNAMAREVNK